MREILVPLVAVVVLGSLTGLCVWLLNDAEVAKLGIASIGSLVSGGVGGYTYRAMKEKSLKENE